jgi:hypothetical protein
VKSNINLVEVHPQLNNNGHLVNVVLVHYAPWLEWTNTHQCTNVDRWCIDGCTFFVPPYPYTNQDGELKLILIFLYLAHVGFFGGTFFYLTPHTYLGLAYLPTFKLLAYAPWFPPSPTYLLVCPSTHHLPTFPITYLPMCLHTKSPPRQWRSCWWKYCNIPSRLLHSPSYLPPS